MENEINAALEKLVKAFNKLNIEYFIGGSVASSLYGIARTTLDADLVAKIKNEHVTSIYFIK